MFDWEILSSYSFLIVALGTTLLAIAAATVGTLTVLKGQSLIGDAIGHSSFPGIVLFFMIFRNRNPVILLLGAIFAGSLAFILIQLINRRSKLSLDNILALILSSFFGLGMVLKSYIQGHPEYRDASQAGLQNYIFGQAAYIMEADVKLILVISILVLIIIAVFFKEIKVFIFDEIYATSIGIKPNFIYALIMLCAMSIIGVGLKLVGAILISSLLIVPAIAALQWSDNFSTVLISASAFAALSAISGSYISTMYRGMSTGPTIILILSCLAFISLIFGPRGFISKYKARRKVQ